MGTKEKYAEGIAKGTHSPWGNIGQQHKPTAPITQDDTQYQQIVHPIDDCWGQKQGKVGKKEEGNHFQKGMGKWSEQWNKGAARKKDEIMRDELETAEKENVVRKDG